MGVFHLLGSGFGRNKERAQQGSAGGRNSTPALRRGGNCALLRALGYGISVDWWLLELVESGRGGDAAI